MNFKKRVIYFVSILSLGLTLDQLTKQLANAFLRLQPPKSYLGEIFTFVYARNKGAWGGLGGHWPELFRQTLLIYLPVAALIALTVYLFYKKDWNRIAFTALTLIVTGGAGNLIDRILYNYVIDFMHIGLGPIGTNIFNVADTLIMTGATLLLIDIYQERKHKKS